MKKAAFYTLGCKVNQYETEAMAELFADSGYEIKEFTEVADVYVINTCSVTNMGDRKSRQIIRRAKKLNPNAVIAVTGCYAQTAPDEVLAIEGVNLVLGTKDRKNIVTLVEELNKLGGAYGVGIADIVEDRLVGMKSRGVYETPGGTILNLAHRGLEEITMDREVMHLRDSLIPRYADMVYNGFWYAPEREMLQAAITESQKFVTGEVRVKLYKGACHVTGRRSEYSLYDDHVASFEDNRAYNHKDAEGFIRLNALRLRVLANSKQKRY